MSRKMSVEEAAANLRELVGALKPQEEILLTTNDCTVAKIVCVHEPQRQQRRPGSAKGILTIVSEDDEHLADFGEYM